MAYTAICSIPRWKASRADGVPVDTFVQTIADFNAHVESGEKDEFGRVTYNTKIEGKYYFAYPRKPAVHHTMGGVRIDEETHALRADGSVNRRSLLSGAKSPASFTAQTVWAATPLLTSACLAVLPATTLQRANNAAPEQTPGRSEGAAVYIG